MHLLPSSTQISLTLFPLLCHDTTSHKYMEFPSTVQTFIMMYPSPLKLQKQRHKTVNSCAQHTATQMGGLMEARVMAGSCVKERQPHKHLEPLIAKA